MGFYGFYEIFDTCLKHKLIFKIDNFFCSCVGSRPSGGCLGAVAVTRVLLGRLEIEVVLNATLAGGVVMGSACARTPGMGGKVR